MKILPEYFDSAQFIQPNYNSHFTIKRPYTNYAKNIQVKFEDYFVKLINIDKFKITMCCFRQNLGNLFKHVWFRSSC